ncbi:MAG TPA: nucleoside-diphosphate kinase [Bacteroidales bacterium]|nr:nucleoside-diphosphate kinase [Bacteroidales bacterium]
MSGNITFTMIKPSAVKSGYIGPILTRFAEAGFRIAALKMHRMTRREAELFYEVHKDKPFYLNLVEFMISGPMVAAILEKANAVEEFRMLIGTTDPAGAAPGTIRRLFGVTVTENAVHGSDSDENAVIEGRFFFSEEEKY